MTRPRSGIRTKGPGGGGGDKTRSRRPSQVGLRPRGFPETPPASKTPREPIVPQAVVVLGPSPTERSASSSAPAEGMPGAIAAAVMAYRRRCADLERLGVPRERADAAILDESREVGGTPRHDETINLTTWSVKVGIPRPVLEALVLAAYHARPPVAPTGPTPAPIPDLPREVPTSSAPGTPAPHGKREP